MINSFDFFSRGFPDKPPFSNLLILDKFSLFLSVEFEIITASTLCFKSNSAIILIFSSLMSGEIFTTIGILVFNIYIN